MKNLLGFGKKDAGVSPKTDNTQSNPPDSGSAIADPVNAINVSISLEHSEQPAIDILEKPVPEVSKSAITPPPATDPKTNTAPSWKAFKANSLSEATGFLNEKGIDPEFVFAGSNGQINIFYKA